MLSVMESHTESHGVPGRNVAGTASGEAAQALSAIEGSRSWLAGRLIAPWWYHLAFGLLAGGAIAEGEARSWLLFGWSLAAYTVGCGALMWWNQRRVGVTMHYLDGCARVVFGAHVLIVAALVTVACWLGLGRGIHGVFLAAGLLAVAGHLLFGRWSDSVLRARVRAGR